jgi:hypothetical protein
MNYAVEMGLDAMICTPRFIKSDLGNQTLIGGYIYRQTARWSHKPPFIFSEKGKQTINSPDFKAAS